VTAVPLSVIALLAQAAPADTVLVAPVATHGWRLWVDLLSGVAQIVIALALLLLGAGAIVAALAARRAYRKALRQIEKLRLDLDPLLRGANTVGENVARISAAAREEADRVQRGLVAAQARAEAAAAVAERRVGEFNALLDVVQEEAEELFIGTASTLRGARAGALAFRRGTGLVDEGEPTDDEVSDEELEKHLRRSERSPRRR
jgi:hypothetical protein